MARQHSRQACRISGRNFALVVASSLVFVVHFGHSAPPLPGNALMFRGAHGHFVASEGDMAPVAMPAPRSTVNGDGAWLGHGKAQKDCLGKPDKDVGPLTLTRDSTTDFGALAGDQTFAPPPQNTWRATPSGVHTAGPMEDSEVVVLPEGKPKSDLSRWGVVLGIGVTLLGCLWHFRANAARFG
jgi:hypothetical protein